MHAAARDRHGAGTNVGEPSDMKNAQQNETIAPVIPIHAIAKTNAEPPLMTAEDLSAYLQVPVATLYKWRTTGIGGPVSIRVGRWIRYRHNDVQDWLDAKSADVVAG